MLRIILFESRGESADEPLGCTFIFLVALNNCTDSLKACSSLPTLGSGSLIAWPETHGSKHPCLNVNISGSNLGSKHPWLNVSGHLQKAVAGPLSACRTLEIESPSLVRQLGRRGLRQAPVARGTGEHDQPSASVQRSATSQPLAPPSPRGGCVAQPPGPQQPPRPGGRR